MRQMSRPIPDAGDADALVGLAREGYDYIGSRCERLGSDIFRTRLLLGPVICVRGADAAELFYDESRFTREGAMPKPVLRLLQDKGSVAALEGEAHRRRKAMFLSLMTGERRADMRRILVERWRARLGRERPGEVVLHDEVRWILCESAFEWCRPPLPAEDAARRTRDLGLMIDGSATLGLRDWRAEARRRRLERALARQVAERRAGRAPDAGCTRSPRRARRWPSRAGAAPISANSSSGSSSGGRSTGGPSSVTPSPRERCLPVRLRPDFFRCLRALCGRGFSAGRQEARKLAAERVAARPVNNAPQLSWAQQS